jgi:tRNA (guanine37-N1)-methyltransferase
MWLAWIGGMAENMDRAKAAAAHLHVALVHAPVLNRQGEVTGSAVTNLDLHDLARCCRTYGTGTYWVVTPYADQQALARELLDYWVQGPGAAVNPDRAEALSLVRVVPDLAAVLQGMAAQGKEQPMLVATSAREGARTCTYRALRAQLYSGRPVLLLFGTASGLAPALLEQAQALLPPIRGYSSYNHLPVRAAAAVVLDRLLGLREDEEERIAC